MEKNLKYIHIYVCVYTHTHTHTHTYTHTYVLVAQLCLTLCDPMDCSPPGSSVRGISRQEYWSGLLLPSPGDLPDPGIKLESFALQADFLPAYELEPACINSE